MLASMSADAPLLNWGELAMGGQVPTGTVSLLLADVEGFTRLWENSPDEMSAALARPQATVCEVAAAHGGGGVWRAHSSRKYRAATSAFVFMSKPLRISIRSYTIGTAGEHLLSIAWGSSRRRRDGGHGR